MTSLTSWAPVSIHSRMVRIQTCGRDWTGDGGGTCIPVLELKYSEIQGLSADGITPTSPIDGFSWQESEDIPLNHAVDFTPESMDIQLVDVNNDHLIDIMRTTGTRMQHSLNLSDYLRYEGRFGSLNAAGQLLPDTSIGGSHSPPQIAD